MEKLAQFYGLSLDEVLHAGHPVLNMHEHASHGYNVIHTQNQHGISEALFIRYCDILDGHTKLLESISVHLAELSVLLAKMKD